MKPTCGWFLSTQLFARLDFSYLSGTIPGDYSGMNTEQPPAACSCLRQAAVSFTKQVQSYPSDADSICCFLAYPDEHQSSC